jgi:hypothetical protein
MYHLVILVSFKSNLQRLSQKNRREPKAVYNAGPGMIKRPNVHLMKSDSNANILFSFSFQDLKHKRSTLKYYQNSS